MEGLTDLNYALLGLLHRRAATGYELMRIFETTPLGGYSASPGAIYPALRKLRGNGLVAVAGEGASGRGALLAITRAGKAALTAWVCRPPGRQPGGGIDIAAHMLKFTFIGDLLTPARQQQFLRDYETALTEAAAALAAARGELEDRLGIHDRLAVEAGTMGYEASLAWCRKARARLEGQMEELRS